MGVNDTQTAVVDNNQKTLKPVLTPAPKLTPEEQKQQDEVKALVASLGLGNNLPRDTTTASGTRDKLTPASAKSLLEKAYKDAGYLGEISNDDVSIFVSKFNEETAKQVDEVVRTVKESIGSNTDPAKLPALVQNVITTQYPSYFDAATYSKDFAWAKINFNDVKTAGGKALDALTKARQIQDDTGADSVSEVELQNYAKQIGKGTLTEDGLKAIFNNKYSTFSYPLFSERLRDTPGITVKDLAQPYIKLMGTELEMDPASIELTNNHLQKALRPDGTAGKVPMMSLADFKTYLRSTPEWEKTTAANDAARQGAIGLAKAFGRGI